ncbi:hypothetical protein [Halobacillus dabanensis]|uniref:hypothetical protein n=1 Tax=Halobacillus dabanensis TaxID=240302 RepID=UPI001ABF2108|nr:hypothetical protein [Halobacillus dabanensis]
MKKQRPIVIVVYGDSWTYGAVADGHDSAQTTENINSWATQLKDHIETLNPNAARYNHDSNNY